MIEGDTLNMIDVHVHPRLNSRPFKTIEEIIRLARTFGIGKICLLGDVLRFGADPTEVQIRTINDLTIRLVNRWPDCMTAFCFINPKNSNSFINQEIERCIVNQSFKGIKLEVSVNARDRTLDPIMRKAEELDSVVLHHCWYKTIDKYANESDPSDIADLASRFPKVNIIMAHLSACGIRGVLDIKSFPNVYVDTSGSLPFSGLVEYAVKELGADRILYGSDAPGRDFSSQLGRIYGARLREKDRKLILGLNAARLLRLTC